MTFSEYIDNIDEPWLKDWITQVHYNQIKSRIEECEYFRLASDFAEHKFWAFSSDLKTGKIEPCEFQSVCMYSIEEIKEQHKISASVNWRKWSKVQMAQRQIKTDFE